ncbi:hypothetical protein MnTg02_03431 [bacterium MnTg02]|nr:hypothetical protein MnTg02_03431 [bacterium MnTg02]
MVIDCLAMVQLAPSPQEQAQFSATLTPHRSLGPRGFIVLMGFISLISFAAGFAFLIIGAWPVLGIFAANVLLIYVAFRLNYRSGRLYETVDLTEDKLKVLRVYPSGKSQSWNFNPYWVRLEIIDQPGKRKVLTLSSHGSRLAIGSFLTDDEIDEFAEVLGGALQQSRGGRRTPG